MFNNFMMSCNKLNFCYYSKINQNNSINFIQTRRLKLNQLLKTLSKNIPSNKVSMLCNVYDSEN